MVATFTVRMIYGQERIYPVNDIARVIANIAGTKTLSVYVMREAKKLGIKWEHVIDRFPIVID